jgi:hypothetical protein
MVVLSTDNQHIILTGPGPFRENMVVAFQSGNSKET